MIPFTQFLLPDGRRRQEAIERPPEIEAKARAIIAEGYEFEVEMLSTGAVSVEIFRHSDEDSLAIEVCENGPPVPIAIDKMVNDAHGELEARKRVKSRKP